MVQEFCTARQARCLNRQKTKVGADFGAMPNSPTPAEHKTAVAANLRAICAVIGGAQSDIAAAIGVSKSKLGNWLRGDNYPDPFAMWLLCERYGVTMDWIYRGRVFGLPGHLADGLKARVSA